MAADPPALSIQIKPGRRPIVTVRIGADVIACERVDLFDPKARSGFIDAITKGRRGIDRSAVQRELERRAAELAGAGDDADGEDQDQPQAAQLVALADAAELFNDPANDLALAAVPVGDDGDQHTEIYPIGAKGFRQWIARRFYADTGRPPNAQALQDALGVLTGKAMFDGPARPTAVRLSRHADDGATYLDLADERWRAIKIVPAGGLILDRSPVAFLRRPGMQALPVPELDAGPDDLAQLRDLMNVADDDTWRLILAFLTGAMRPAGPYPILGANGEQGSGKSTICREIRRSIDPNKSDLRSAPRDERDLIIAASNGHLVGFDNLSTINLALSDALCRISTGAGFATRELYSDDGERIFSVCRPVIVNGIGDLLDQPDLLDRAIVVTLPPIPDSRRRPEVEIWAEYERIRPRILGALINAAATAMKREATVDLPDPPRMADFARWISAAEPALGVPVGSLIEAYRRNRSAAGEIAIEASATAAAVIELIDRRGGFDGPVGELLRSLNDLVDHDLKARPDWPRTPKGLGNKLVRIAPILRRVGIDVIRGDRGEHGYPIRVCRTSAGSSSGRSARSAEAAATGHGGADQDGIGQVDGRPAEHRPGPSSGERQARSAEDPRHRPNVAADGPDWPADPRPAELPELAEHQSGSVPSIQESGEAAMFGADTRPTRRKRVRL